MKKNFVYSTSEYVIEYRNESGGTGTIIIDCNYYDKINKILQRKLKGCEITSWIQRPKTSGTP